jgi:hypothetical protein
MTHDLMGLVGDTTMGNKLDNMSDDGLDIGLEPSQVDGMLHGQQVKEIEDMKQSLHIGHTIKDCVVEGKCLSNVWEGWHTIDA